MKIYKRIVVNIIVLIVILSIFVLAFELIKRTKNYKYLTYNNTWGISNNCFENEQKLFCEVENNLINVSQYYIEN